MLEVDSVSVVIDGQTILDRVGLIVEDGEVVAVLGPSGAGKSTLLRVVAGLQSPDQGTIRWDDPTSAAFFPTAGNSVSCSRTTPCSPISMWGATSCSDCGWRALRGLTRPAV